MEKTFQISERWPWRERSHQPQGCGHSGVRDRSVSVVSVIRVSTLLCRRDANLDVPVRLRGHGKAELEDDLSPNLATQGASLEKRRVFRQSVRTITGTLNEIIEMIVQCFHRHHLERLSPRPRTRPPPTSWPGSTRTGASASSSSTTTTPTGEW